TAAGEGRPALVSVFGGKLTSYRSLAEKVMKRLGPALGFRRGPWTAEVPLPGGDLPAGGLEALVDSLRGERPGFALDFLLALTRRHGTLAAEILGDAREPADLGEDFGGGLREKEVRWFVEREWARTLEDVLWRRTKAGLHATQVQRERLRTFLGGENEGRSGTR
ncbi:MAG: glycerol-3-phosphate dehydrogenase C-terminal domain-containing protein, partial [Planctomycetota bacterium]